MKYRADAVSPPVVEALPCIYREATVVEERVDVARVEVPVTTKNPVVVALVIRDDVAKREPAKIL